MDYIYGKLNIPTENKRYSGKLSKTFDTEVEEKSKIEMVIRSYFLINSFIRHLTVTGIKCSDQTLCSNNTIVGSRVIRYYPPDYPLPGYDYEFDGSNLTLIDAPYVQEGGVIIVE